MNDTEEVIVCVSILKVLRSSITYYQGHVHRLDIFNKIIAQFLFWLILNLQSAVTAFENVLTFFFNKYISLTFSETYFAQLFAFMLR